LHRHGIDDPELAIALAETFVHLRRKKHIVYSDTTRVLERLSQNHSLGLLTNGAPDLQRRKIEGAGLAGYFDQVLISGDIGIGKPERSIFETLLTRLGATTESVLMIGNSLNSDIQGAQGAGIRAVWLNRSGQYHDIGIIPDWEISSLDELPPILTACAH
jgi:putative hydrolase of the HAD superfamily